MGLMCGSLDATFGLGIIDLADWQVNVIKRR